MEQVRNVQVPRRRRRVRAGRALAAVGVAGVLAACTPVPPVQPPAGGLEIVGEVQGFDRPWELQFTPDRTPLITERGGRIVTITNSKRRVIATVPNVRASGEAGLMGLAVDPNFATNRHIFVCHTSPSDVRVVRYTVDSAYTSIGSGTPIITGIPSGAGNRHNGCRLTIGTSGELWTTTGDAVLASVATNRASLAGKVLRTTRSGAPWPSNPATVEPAAGWNPLVFTRGHRNPQGLTIRPSDGAVFSVEHGTGCDDEVNRIAKGADYGWNPQGPFGNYLEGAPMTAAGATPAVWSSGCPTVAPSGATFLRGAQWGQRQGLMVLAVLKDQRLTLLDVSGPTARFVEHQFVGRNRLRSVTMGPEGSLWVVEDGVGASILRVDAK